MQASDTIADRLAEVRGRIAAAAKRAGRAPEAVRLVAVSKTVAAERVAEAAAGVTDFGENYVQEAQAKIAAVSGLTKTDVCWHFIGHLQSNKAKYSIALFSLIQSVYNYQLAQELQKHASKQGKTQPVLIQVNLSGEAQRSGVAPSEALTLAEKVAEMPGLALQGLMGMAPFGERPEDARPHFAALRGLYEALPEPNRQVLSMGMSGDFEVAIEEGSTLVRIGTALFGQRRRGG